MNCCIEKPSRSHLILLHLNYSHFILRSNERATLTELYKPHIVYNPTVSQHKLETQSGCWPCSPALPAREECVLQMLVQMTQLQSFIELGSCCSSHFNASCSSGQEGHQTLLWQFVSAQTKVQLHWFLRAAVFGGDFCSSWTAKLAMQSWDFAEPALAMPSAGCALVQPLDSECGPMETQPEVNTVAF